jgi:hypothetical protein
MGSLELGVELMHLINRHGPDGVTCTVGEEDGSLTSLVVVDTRIGARLTLAAITPEDLASLRADSERLSALEQAGVDNWEGYSRAMSIMRGDDE